MVLASLNYWSVTFTSEGPGQNKVRTKSAGLAETEVPIIMLSEDVINSFGKWMLTGILFLIMKIFLMDKMMLLLHEKLTTYLNLRTFVEEVCLCAIQHLLEFGMRKIASDTANQLVKLVKKSLSFFKKKNPDVPNCEINV